MKVLFQIPILRDKQTPSTRWRSSKELPVFCGSLYNFSRDNALGFRALGLGCRVHNIEPITEDCPRNPADVARSTLRTAPISITTVCLWDLECFWCRIRRCFAVQLQVSHLGLEVELLIVSIANTFLCPNSRLVKSQKELQ